MVLIKYIIPLVKICSCILVCGTLLYRVWHFENDKVVIILRTTAASSLTVTRDALLELFIDCKTARVVVAVKAAYARRIVR